jgi:hypothetical protein
MLTIEAEQTIASNFVICYQLGCFYKVEDNVSETIALSGLRIRGLCDSCGEILMPIIRVKKAQSCTAFNARYQLMRGIFSERVWLCNTL